VFLSAVVALVVAAAATAEGHPVETHGNSRIEKAQPFRPENRPQ
jgi:hypothetical protein